MTKKFSRNTVPGPSIVSTDELSVATDDELYNRIQLLEGEKEGIRESRNSAHEWEIEIAYVRREQQIRRARREKHDEYVKSIYGDSEAQVLSDEYEGAQQ